MNGIAIGEIRRVFVLVVPEWSQVSVAVGVVGQLLAHDPNLKVDFYGVEPHGAAMERSGAHFRPASYFAQKEPSSSARRCCCFGRWLLSSSQSLE